MLLTDQWDTAPGRIIGTVGAFTPGTPVTCYTFTFRTAIRTPCTIVTVYIYSIHSRCENIMLIVAEVKYESVLLKKKKTKKKKGKRMRRVEEAQKEKEEQEEEDEIYVKRLHYMHALILHMKLATCILYITCSYLDIQHIFRPPHPSPGDIHSRVLKTPG